MIDTSLDKQMIKYPQMRISPNLDLARPMITIAKKVIAIGTYIILVGSIAAIVHFSVKPATDFSNAQSKLEFEAFVDTASEDILLKGVYLNGKERHMELSLTGQSSSCDVAAGSPLLDVRGNLIRTSGVLSGRCVLDVMFLFRRFRRFILSHESATFVHSEIQSKEGIQCMETPNMGRSLCVTRHSGIDVHWFSERTDFPEVMPELNIDIAGVDAVLEPSKSSTRTSEMILDVAMGPLMKQVEVHFDVGSRRLLLVPRTPSLGLKQAAAVTGAISTFLFVIRLMKENTRDNHPIVHVSMLAFALITSAIGLGSQANAMASVPFWAITVGTLVIHLAVEIYRMALGPGHAILKDIDMKPDLSIFTIAVIIAMYTIASHSLVVISTFMVIFYSVKTVSELVNIRWVTADNTVVYMLLTVTDLTFTLTMWHYIVWEFLSQTLVASYYLQDILLIVLTIGGGVMVAKARYVSTIRPQKPITLAK